MPSLHWHVPLSYSISFITWRVLCRLQRGDHCSPCLQTCYNHVCNAEPPAGSPALLRADFHLCSPWPAAAHACAYLLCGRACSSRTRPLSDTFHRVQHIVRIDFDYWATHCGGQSRSVPGRPVSCFVPVPCQWWVATGPPDHTTRRFKLLLRPDCYVILVVTCP